MDLHSAIQSGNIESVSCILDAGADVNQTNVVGSSALYVATELGNEPLVELLLKKGANVEATNRQDNEKPIHIASKNGNLQIIKTLVRHGADVYSKSNNDIFLPIHLAAGGGHVAVIDYFFKKGMDVDTPSPREHTALMHAAFYGQLRAVEFLLEKNADINYKDESCTSALHFACIKGQTEVVKYLIDKGAPSEENLNGKTPLHSAIESNQEGTTQFLLEKIAHHDLTSEYFHILFEIAETGKTKILKCFLEKGIDVNVQTNNGYSLLHAAANKGQASMVQILIDNGADVEAKCYRRGNTPLHMAAYYCKPYVLDVLIRNGADFEVCDKDGNRPIDLVPKKYTRFSTESGRKDQLDCAKILVKYILLKHRSRSAIYLEDFCFQKELVHFCNNCLKELEEMKTCFINNTTISLYKLIQSMFNENQLSVYLCNEFVKEELENPLVYFQNFPIYHDVRILLIENKIKHALRRKDFIEKATLGMDTVVPKLPIQIWWEIFSYLSTTDLHSITLIN